MTGERWVTQAEAAVILGKSSRTIRRYVAAGKLEINREVSPHLVNVADMADKVSDTMADEVSDTSGQRRTTTDTQVRELRAKVDRLASENERLKADNDRLRDVLDEVRSDRDYLRQAHAASLSTQQRLLEHVEGEGGRERGRQGELEGFTEWLRRVFPWLGGGK